MRERSEGGDSGRHCKATSDELTESTGVEDGFPDLSSRVLALLWLLLFGVRWLLITPLEWTGTLTPQQMGLIDDVLLLPLYLTLFVLTCVVLGLRAARRLQAPISPNRPGPGGPGIR